VAKLYYNVRSLFIYHNYDSTAYWKKRSVSCAGQSRVLWQNEQYNILYRELQKDILAAFIPKIVDEKKIHILDVGCGIGVVAKMLVNIYPEILVDAIDFPEMTCIAKIENPHERIKYLESSAEDYINEENQYKLIISSGCYSSIRDIDKMKKSIINGIKMIDPCGTILMIDPFHKWSYLARVRFSSGDMIRFMKTQGFVVVHKGGVLFWPFRVLLCNPNYQESKLPKRFKQGEWLLKKFGQHFWADYKILAFKKIL
jgi:2-polyprenyl-3-methyl-5-hydroxy-6-metoxy-1,4-benzoquinol methylase